MELSSIQWRQRDFQLKKENVPPWKAAAFRQENMDQLFYEWTEEGLPFDTFSHLLQKESRKYGDIVDGTDPAVGLDSYSDDIEAVLPNFKEKIKDFESTLTCEKVLDMKCVKTALNQCEQLNSVVGKEIDIIGNLAFPNPPAVLDDNDKPSINQEIVENEAKSSTDNQSSARQFKFKQVRDNQRQFSINHKPLSKGTETSPDVEVGPKKFFKIKRKFEAEIEHEPEEMETEPEKKFHFKSAREQLQIDQRKNKRSSAQVPAKKSLGARPRTNCFGKFIPPSSKDQSEREYASKKSAAISGDPEEMEISDPRLKNIDPKIIDLVTNEIMDHGPPVQWCDIAGLEFAKTTIKEIVIWPMLRPDIFTGLRGPPKGILLFGPPGTGKTLIGKCIASQSGATFFSISASSLTSKWVGEGEKMVRALFAVASCHQPAVIFIDEIDSLLTQRSDVEHESSRRIKTEFLVQLDGASTSSEERILVVGATNRPQEIDEAARRRLSKRLYIPLPEADARKQIVESLLNQQSFQLSDEELDQITLETDGYSGADMANLCREAALGPIRSLQGMDISAISKDDVRAIHHDDFKKALCRVRPSVSKKDLKVYEEWNQTFGCCSF